MSRTLGEITVGAGFSQTNDCPPHLQLGGSCQIMVTFSPTASGSVLGFLTIPNSDIDGPTVLELHGAGE